MKLPQYPEFKDVGLEDRDVFRSFLEGYPVEVCELNFGNTFIWRHFDHPRYTIIKGNLCLRFTPPDEPPYFLQPVGGGGAARDDRNVPLGGPAPVPHPGLVRRR